MTEPNHNILNIIAEKLEANLYIIFTLYTIPYTKHNSIHIWDVLSKDDCQKMIEKYELTCLEELSKKFTKKNNEKIMVYKPSEEVCKNYGININHNFIIMKKNKRNLLDISTAINLKND